MAFYLEINPFSITKCAEYNHYTYYFRNEIKTCPNSKHSINFRQYHRYSAKNVFGKILLFSSKTD